MNIRPINLDNDYEILMKWSTDRNIGCPPKDFLSPHGFIVDDICAAFLYKTDSNVCFFECLISNSLVDKDIRDQGLDLLLKTITDESVKLNYKYMYSNFETTKIVERFKEFKFSIYEHPVYFGIRVNN